MKVLFLIPASGGIGRYGVLLARALAQAIPGEVLTIFDESLAGSPLFGPIAAQYGASTINTLGRLGRLQALRKIGRQVRQFRPDIIHDCAGSAGPLAPWLWYVPGVRRKLVVTEHDPRPHSEMGGTISKRLARRSLRKRPALVVTHGSNSARELKLAGGGTIPVTVVPHGEMSIYGKLGDVNVARDPRTVLFFGAMRPNKGVDWLIPIAERVRKSVPEARFLVAGSTRLSRELSRTGWPVRLEQTLARMRSHPAFQLLEGYVPDSEVGNLFRRSAVTLLPYRDATASGVGMIAMALGSCVVATRVGNLEEVFQDGTTALFAPAEPDAIADRVIELLQLPKQAELLAQRAREVAQDRFSWPRIARRTVAAYERLLSSDP